MTTYPNRFRLIPAIAATALVAAIAVTSPAAAATRTCSGSFGENGSYRTDKKGIIRTYRARNSSCPAARKLIRALAKANDPKSYFGRRGTLIVAITVKGGQAWKCRIGFVVDGRRRSLFGINPEKAKTITEDISCRPTTGRLDRRVTATTANLRDEFIKESG